MNLLNKKNHGFSIVEVILAIAIFTVGIIGIGLFLVDIMLTAERAQNLNQAVLIAEEGLEATKAIRDNDFDDIVDGTYGLVLTDDVWSFDATPDVTDLGEYGNVFTRSIIIEETVGSPTATSSIKLVTSQVDWPSRSGTSTVSLYTYITNWER